MIDIKQRGTNLCLVAAQLARLDDLRITDQYSRKMSSSEYLVLKSHASNFFIWDGSNSARDSTQELAWPSTSASIGLKTRFQGQVTRRSGRMYWGWEDMFGWRNLCAGCWRHDPAFIVKVHMDSGVLSGTYDDMKLYLLRRMSLARCGIYALDLIEWSVKR